ncbi:2,3-bisphosphoglycerate-independent phosphoglycerate mutase [bacterium]|nr:2,3-bisphosphoglycerate-independent phosphoglycerate mutase [bacterium]
MNSNPLIKPRTGLLVILDGFGINPSPKDNAVAQARMPFYRALLQKYPHTQIEASEKNVGLPSGFMGNSEVGHLNIGAGRVVFQDFSLISRAIEEKSFFSNRSLVEVCRSLKREGKEGTLHLMGLLSDGGVHSHISHVFALIQLAKAEKISSVKIHCFMDGRDTPPKSGQAYLDQLSTFIQQENLGQIASVMGRFYAMDRDTRWDRTQLAYDAIVKGQAQFHFSDPQKVLSEAYSRQETDEFVSPSVAEGYSGIADGDAIIFFNFRADRARQLTRALTQKTFEGFERTNIPKLSGFVCMTPYDETLNLPTAFEKAKIPLTLGEVVSNQSWHQLRIAETEKYAHVTYFFNGGDERVFPGEKRILVPSPREVKTYDLKPEMSAETVTTRLIQELEMGDYQLVVVNFANPDMVGHTGNLPAAVSALETIDRCLGRIVDWVEKTKSFCVVTADHGNCEMMRDKAGNPVTSHTLLPVPFILVDPLRVATKLAASGKLSDIAPTFLKLWNLPVPKEMTGQSLVIS